MTDDIQANSTLSHEKDQSARTLLTVRQAIFWVSLPFGLLNFALPIYGLAVGADAVQIGLFFSVFFLMLVLLRPLVGAGLDRFGRRPFFIVGLLAYVVTMFVFALYNQVAGILLARVIQGVASAFLWLSAQAITADMAGQEARGRAFGGVEQASSQGATFGALIGFGVLYWMDVELGWQILFAGYGLAGLWAAWLAWRNLQETNPAKQARVKRPIPWSRPWILLMLVTAVTGAAWAMVSPILMIYLQEKLSTDAMILGLAYFPAALIWASLPARLGGLADRFGRKPLMVLGMAVAALSSFLIPGLSSLATLAILWAIQALCYAAGDPAEQALVADLTGGDQRGRAYGLYAMVGGLGAAIGPLAGGWLYQNVGPSAPFYANGLVLATCTLVLFAFLQTPASNKP